MPLSRSHWVRKIAELDPEGDCREIYRLTSTLEFPWDMTQALGLALYRTYAIPSIGRLLADTGELTGRTQKRYDDTGLILEAILEHGFDAEQGRAGIRRMNQMHGAYAIGNDDLRYVLCTFVVVPIRWLEEYGYRPLSDAEKVAAANYYRRLGAMMNITDIPATWQQFGSAMDAYEREHLGFDEGGRAVSDATLDLMARFPPLHLLPARLVQRFALSLMDDALLDAYRYAHPTRLERTVYRGAIKARARLLRHLPARRAPAFFREQPQVRSYPHGYDVADLGTFPTRRTASAKLVCTDSNLHLHLR